MVNITLSGSLNRQSKLIWAIWAAVICSIALSACRPTEAATEQTASSAAESVATSVVAPPVRVNLLLDTAQLQQAQHALTQLPEFSGSPTIWVFEKIHFFDGVRPRIELAIQNPALPDKLTFYTFEHGKWTASEAEDISHIKNLKRHLFALDKVDFRQVKQVAEIWHRQAQSIQAVIDEPYYVAWVFLPKQNKYFWHTATLESTGTQFYLGLHQDGSVWEWKRLAGQSSEEQ